MPDIWFPNLGIEIQKIDPVAFSLFGLDVYWYGIIIALGVLSGFLLVSYRAKKSGQDPEVYMDFLIYALIFSIIGARLYYVIFSWDDYKDNLLKIFATREGGLAIYGGVIAAVLTCIIYCRIKKLSFWTLVDTAAPALILGQIIGRWGNFVNQEAFGGYTNNVFAMRLKLENVYNVPQSVMDKIVEIGGVQYVQVHPTFLYESVWNLGVLIFLLAYTKHKKFNGEIFFMYLLGYGLGRVWIEGLRTDQLLIGHTTVPASQLLAGVLIIFSIVAIVYKRHQTSKSNK